MAEYIRIKMATLEVAGPHKYATHTGSLPQYTNGQPNLLVAPVRKHMIQYFPSHKTLSGNGIFLMGVKPILSDFHY